jgi:hypothetical protein
MFSTAVRRSAAGWAQAPLAQSPTVTQMAMFVHLTTESRIPRIRRTGIARLRKPVGTSPAGVYAVPVTRNFYASHQWLRELKRRNQGAIAGIYFRVPDEQLVWVGHYGKAHRFVTSAQAIAEFTKADDPLGWEVVVPRRIEANEIHKTRRLPQVIGWRFSPKDAVLVTRRLALGRRISLSCVDRAQSTRSPKLAAHYSLVVPGVPEPTEHSASL